jgi:hypothetical protein
MKVLRARLYELEREKQAAKSKSIEDMQLDIGLAARFAPTCCSPIASTRMFERRSKSATWTRLERVTLKSL